jgi:hypothetical protein
MSLQIRHAQSHVSLLRDVPTSVVPSSRSHLDAIVVPTARPAAVLQDVIDLSALISVPLVILCSRQAQVEQVAKRVEDTFGARALIIEVREGYELPGHPPGTSSGAILKASAGRASDVSVKRNLGLRLARMRGWKKILFLDDDIRQVRPQHVAQLASTLGHRPVASMASRVFPDNSVVCHARRLAGLDQDVFVSGAVLGVNLQHPALSFFPDIYNEDWFFFARHAAARVLPKIGEVRQTEYRPFSDPARAEQEEFGDLLAEGLYALFETTPGWAFKDQRAAASRASHWRRFTESRLGMIDQIKRSLLRVQDSASLEYTTILQAQESLRHAEEQLQGISADLCVQFIEKWQEDEIRWQEILRSDRAILSERDALAELDLTGWISCGYGSPPVSTEA